MKTFYHLLITTTLVSVTNFFVWFSLIYWAYLNTKSVIATGVIGGIFLVATALSGLWFGSLVDHYKKKKVMIGSSMATLLLFILGFLIYTFSPTNAFTNIASPLLWTMVVILLLGAIAENLYSIAVPTLVTVLVPEKNRDKANGMFGMVMGIAFAISNVGSGLILGFGQMSWVLAIGVISTVIALIYLFFFIHIPEKHIIHVEGEVEQPKKNIDIKGTIAAVRAIPGLFGLILFNCFNNFLGGVFMALMDAYGLSLVSVQVWGTLWGVLSLGFILGGLFIAKKGLGKNPLRTLFLTNIILWIVAIISVIQPSIWLLAVCMGIYVCLIPFIEATEQTIIQKVVPHERQGRVFGFAQSVEQAASPLTSFLIGPITQIVFIPFMTTGAGVELIGDWFGVGQGRGIALVFILSGIIGLIVTLLAMRTKAYSLLSAKYQEK